MKAYITFYESRSVAAFIKENVKHESTISLSSFFSNFTRKYVSASIAEELIECHFEDIDYTDIIRKMQSTINIYSVQEETIEEFNPIIK